MFLVIVFGFVFQVTKTEWVLLVLSIGFVLTAEIFNSAIEVLTNLVSPEQNSKAGLTKDMAAGAVLISAITAAIVGLIIFVPKLLELL
jgi:diacylglycerol kinase